MNTLQFNFFLGGGSGGDKKRITIVEFHLSDTYRISAFKRQQCLVTIFFRLLQFKKTSVYEILELRDKIFFQISLISG